MIQWWIICLIFLIKSSFINSINSQCNYTINRLDNSFDTCLGDQCNKFIDLYSIMVKPKTCKTSLLSLSFSSYQNFILFRDRLQWKLGELFSSNKLINEVRQLILYIDRLDYNDKPFDHDQLIHLGYNIDFYLIYIREIKNQNYLYGSIHYHPNDSQWNIIKLKFRCLKLSAFDKYPCSNEIISPSIFAPQRPSQTVQSTTQISFSTQLFSTKSNEEKKKSTHLILIILLPLLTILTITFIFILVYKYIIGNCCLKRTTIITPESPHLTNISNHPDNTEKISSSSSLSGIGTIPENTSNADQILHPIGYHDYQLHTRTHLTTNLNNNYERVNVDGISLGGQQYFVPISSSNRF